MKLNTGDIAPSFKLFNTDKQEVSLDTYRGKKVLLLFFPLAFTGTCTTELCMVRDELSQYNELDATVFGISIDTPHSLKKFKEEQQLNFDLLSDFNKTTSEAYGCLYDTFVLGMKGVSKRSAFVIDREGILRYEEILEVAGDLPDFVKIKKALGSIN